MVLCAQFVAEIGIYNRTLAPKSYTYFLLESYFYNIYIHTYVLLEIFFQKYIYI